MKRRAFWLAVIAPISAGLTFAFGWLLLESRFPSTPEWILFTVVCPIIYGLLYLLAVKMTPK